MKNTSRTFTSILRIGSALVLLATGCGSANHAAKSAWSGKSVSLDYYSERCDAGDANECANAARVLVNPSSTYRDAALAVQFRSRACEKNAYYCGDLGQMYLSGQGVPKDEQRGLSYLDKGCASKNAVACTTAQQVHQRAQVVAEKAKTPPSAPPSADPLPAQTKDSAVAPKKPTTKKGAKSTRQATKQKAR